MPKFNVIDLEGKAVGEVHVADEVFAAEVKEHLLWEVVRAQRAARRAGTAKVKGRSEVNVTKAKMAKQKGTGNARHGSRRANVFRGGGQVHGPVPRSYAMHVNKKVMAGALRSALSLRAQAGDLLVVRDFALPEIKTRYLAKALRTLAAEHALLVDDVQNHTLVLSSRNLPKANLIDPQGLNVYDILRHPKLLVSERSLRAIEARFVRNQPEAAPQGAA